MIDIMFVFLLGALAGYVACLSWLKWRFTLPPLHVPQERLEAVLPHPARVARDEYDAFLRRCVQEDQERSG